MTSTTQKILSLFALLAVLLIVSLIFPNAVTVGQKEGPADDISFEPYRSTLSGEMVCLPHRDPNVQTKECVRGMKTDTGEYYAIDFALMSQIPPDLSVGDRFSGNGVVTPIERLSTDYWQQYRVEGIFSVTDSVEKL